MLHRWAPWESEKYTSESHAPHVAKELTFYDSNEASKILCLPENIVFFLLIHLSEPDYFSHVKVHEERFKELSNLTRTEAGIA